MKSVHTPHFISNLLQGRYPHATNFSEPHLVVVFSLTLPMAVVVSTHLAGRTFERVKMREQTVSVKGSAEQLIHADRATNNLHLGGPPREGRLKTASTSRLGRSRPPGKAPISAARLNSRRFPLMDAIGCPRPPRYKGICTAAMKKAPKRSDMTKGYVATSPSESPAPMWAWSFKGFAGSWFADQGSGPN